MNKTKLKKWKKYTDSQYEAEVQIKIMVFEHQEEHGFHSFFDHLLDEIENLKEEIKTSKTPKKPTGKGGLNLFDYMAECHDLYLLDTDLDDIRVAASIDKGTFEELVKALLWLESQRFQVYEKVFTQTPQQ